MRTINKIILHCAATPQGKDFTVDNIDLWHRQRGFSKVGYHYIVCLDGAVQQGRREDEIGAHCLGQNGTSIGICYIGGIDEAGRPKDTRTYAQRMALRELVNDIKHRYEDIEVYGHYEFANKACPCFDVEEEYRRP